MKKLVLLTAMCLSSTALANAPFELETSRPDMYGISKLIVNSKDDLTIEGIIINRGQCQLMDGHLPNKYLVNREDMRQLQRESGLHFNEIGFPQQMWEWVNFIKDKTNANTFPATLEFAEKRVFYYNCKGKRPIIEVSIKTNKGEWTFGGQ